MRVGKGEPFVIAKAGTLLVKVVPLRPIRSRCNTQPPVRQA